LKTPYHIHNNACKNEESTINSTLVPHIFEMRPRS